MFIRLGIILFTSFSIVGCTAALHQFQDGLVAIAGQGGTIARADAFEPALKAASQYKNVDTAQIQMAFDGESADIIQFIDNDQVLVGTIDVGAYLGVPDYGRLALYDIEAGTKIWSIERPPMSGGIGAYAVLTTNPVILLR